MIPQDILHFVSGCAGIRMSHQSSDDIDSNVEQNQHSPSQQLQVIIH